MVGLISKLVYVPCFYSSVIHLTGHFRIYAVDSGWVDASTYNSIRPSATIDNQSYLEFSWKLFKFLSETETSLAKVHPKLRRLIQKLIKQPISLHWLDFHKCTVYCSVVYSYKSKYYISKYY